jgi:hypothetical protein
MATTYEKIATTTLGSASATIDFTSIASTWTDIKLVLVCTSITGNGYIKMRFNNDSSTLYSYTSLYGNGSAAASGTNTGENGIDLTRYTENKTTTPTMRTADIFSYAGSTFKTVLAQEISDLNGSGSIFNSVNLYRSTSAINQITLTATGNNFATGTIATIYGILKA